MAKIHKDCPLTKEVKKYSGVRPRYLQSPEPVTDDGGCAAGRSATEQESVGLYRHHFKF